ncbi:MULTISPECIES: hypothetical protein [Mycobacterium]|uniref:Uncharacterized protein n=2 Tax=Mycobacterium TaxID=1763 RepID=A0A1W9ZA92_MYCAN|nr:MULTISPECIES: hypothetical protein [Mycobacterium]MCV7075075.1 hypothetical protein [Mycobacterium szulgai]MCV7199593.1 hypothetical protein [Mycobacterium angelicum]ORA10300.1 hypothetical protein BST12_26850 [Mycobacterium angelicum]ORW93038.1 hypothetical protein AWC27_08150 [Mycobacterium szulgai]
MRAMKLAGLAVVTAFAPIAILLGSGTAHADSDLGKPCSPEGAKVWGNPGPIYCQRNENGDLQWVPIAAWQMCVAFCDRLGGP